MALRDAFASQQVRRLAREEAAYAVRTRGAGAVDHLQQRAVRSEDAKRRQVYRIAAKIAATSLRTG